jgi:hypothetical protein
MKVLILDHHFRQDVDALWRRAPSGTFVRTLSPMVFATEAARLFPAKVFDSDLAAFHAPELARARDEYRAVARQIVFDLYRIFPFDVFISPSDTFFYIRDAIDACGELAIPFVVVQKETGVSAKSLEHHAPEMLRWFPFKGSWMTTCSRRSAEFWIQCGAERERISVTGQPRFDFYRDRELWSSWEELGVSLDPAKKVVLFLSYDLNAYDENRALGAMHQPWEQLHRETEYALLDAAMAGNHTVLIKPHPQQSAAELAALNERCREGGSVQMLSGGLDTRQLIVNSDVVVGFQTTALAEAMAAGKDVVYTFWTEAVERTKELLLPYHTLAGAITVARSADDLRRTLNRDRVQALDEAMTAIRTQFLDDYLGPIDGKSSSRVWEVIAHCVADAATFTGASALALRSELRQQGNTYAQQQLRVARRRRLTRANSERVAMGLGRIGQTVRRRLRDARDAEDARMLECREAISGDYSPFGHLIGPNSRSLPRAALSFFRYRLDRVAARMSRS